MARRGTETDEVLALLISCGIPAHAAEAYMPGLVGRGFDSCSAVKTLKKEDMDELGIKEGHRRLLQQSVLAGHSASAERPAAPSSEPSAARKRPEPAGAAKAAAAGKRARHAAAGEPASLGGELPLSGLVICVSGSMSMVRKEFHKMLVEHGARVALSATGTTTQLVTTASEAGCPTRKVLQATSKNVSVVSEQFIHDSIANGSPIDDKDYLLLDKAEASGSTKWPAGSRSGRGAGGAAAMPSSGGGGGAAAAMPSSGGRRLGGGTTEAPLHEVITAARGAAPVVTVVGEKASEDAARQVMLAQKWDPRLDPTGWWISEKLDGVRAYWDGRNFYSRLGNAFPAPEWFKKGLPPTPLDGELWCGRRQFRRCLSIVRNRSSGDLWEYITYLVFDAPAMDEGYEERVAFIKRTVLPADKSRSDASSGSGGRCPFAAPVGIVRCEGVDQLKRHLATVDAKGGEGLMLREPGSKYEHRRAKCLRKVKSDHDEEAKVVGHEGGRGRNGFHTGALVLETPDGRRFSCGSGLSAEDRRRPPEVGTVVTYRFTELMDNGYPRFPVYVAPRIDLDWETICAGYAAPSAKNFAPGELRRDHSIMFAEPALARSLTMRADALPATGGDAAREPEVMASSGSEGGETEAEDSDADADSPRARQYFTAGGREDEAAAGGGFRRTRSQLLADETGLDLATARALLGEHDRAAGGSDAAAAGPSGLCALGTFTA